MFNNYEYEKIMEKYSELVKERQIRTLKIWGPILFFSILILAIIYLFTNWWQSEVGVILVPLYGGLAVFGSITAVFVSKYGTSQKPAFNYLYKEIYNKINTSEGKNISYTAFEKTENDFVGRGGLFTRHSRVQTNRHVIGDFQGTEYHIIDCMLITGSGNNQAVHFNGIYYYFKEKSNSLLQVRTNGRPQYKGHKYDKVDNSDEFGVYVEKGKSIRGNDRQYIHNLLEIKNRLNAKRIYFSKTIDEMHFAYVPTIQVRKQKNLTLQKLNELCSFFQNEEIVVRELMTISGDYNF